MTDFYLVYLHRRTTYTMLVHTAAEVIWMAMEWQRHPPCMMHLGALGATLWLLPVSASFMRVFMSLAAACMQHAGSTPAAMMLSDKSAGMQCSRGQWGRWRHSTAFLLGFLNGLSVHA